MARQRTISGTLAWPLASMGLLVRVLKPGGLISDGFMRRRP
jgi:hypothetical protein